MKKLMIAAAIVCAAAMSQAAIVQWGLSTGAVSFNSTKLGSQAVQLYMVGVDGAKDVLIDTRNTANAPTQNKGKLNSGVGSQSYDYTSTVAGGPVWSADDGDLGREYYMVLTYNDGKTDYTYTSSAVASSGLTDKSLGSVAFTFNDKIIASGTDGWVAAAVPEPTSGLLLLLGVAGLALRRRRA